MGRQRFVYSPEEGTHRTAASLGDPVRAGEVVAHIDTVPLAAPIDGVILALTRDGVPVARLVRVEPEMSPGEKFLAGAGAMPQTAQYPSSIIPPHPGCAHAAAVIDVPLLLSS